MTVVWLKTISDNTYSALYPTDAGLVPIGYAIENGAKWEAISHADSKSASPYSCNSKQEAAQYLLKKSNLLGI